MYISPTLLFCNTMYVTIIIGADPRCCGYYGEGSGPISVHLVSCNGTEANITSCSYLTSTVNDHHNDVGVQCQRGHSLSM